ncbi:hypothetical protein [Nonomuraea sp. CA-141351]
MAVPSFLDPYNLRTRETDQSADRPTVVFTPYTELLDAVAKGAPNG